jgi:outer membrane receptor protein involved in Fe transport
LLSVEETAISRGGFDVDQGTVSSGAISVVTREGGPRYDITSKFYTSDFSKLGDNIYRNLDANYGDPYRDFMLGRNLDLSSPENRHHSKYRLTELAIGGPILPFNRKGAKFFFSTKYDNSQGRFPISDDPDYRNWNESYQWKISVPYSSLKFYTSGFYYRQTSKGYSPGWRFALDHLSTFKDNRLQFIVGINHIISPKTYWELRIGSFHREFTNNVFEDVDHDGVDDFDDRDRDGFVEIDLDYFKAFIIDTFRTWGEIDSIKTRWEFVNIDSLFTYVSPAGDTLHPTINEAEGWVEIPYYWWDMLVQSLYPSIGSGPRWWPQNPYYIDPITGDTVAILDPETGDTTLLTTYGWGQRTRVDMKVLEVQTPSGIDTVIEIGTNVYEFPFQWPLVPYGDSIIAVTDTVLKLGNQWLPNEHTWERTPYYYGKSGYVTATWKLTSQVTRNHEILAGVEYKKIDITRYVSDYVSGGNTYFSHLNPPIDRRPGDYYNVIDWFKENPLKPWIIAAYVRDKIEMEGMVAKIGIRFDYYDPGGFTLSDTNDPFITDSVWNNLRTFKNPKKAKKRWYFSPRIGISHPITEWDVLHFTYGHYFQIPAFSQIISSYVFSGAFPVIGNADIEPEKTISYELGIKHAFTPQLILDVTAFYKDIKDWSRLKMFTYGAGGNYSTYVNEDWGSVRGIELEFQKRPGGAFLPYFSWDVTYTYQVATGSFSSPWNAYTWQWRGYPLPPYESPLDWDQRHSLIVTLGFNVPKGKTLFGTKVLSDLGITVQHWYGSGYPFTPPINTLREAIENINSERLPSYQTTDLRIYKGIEVGPARALLYLDITNLFNRKDLSSPNDIQWYYQFGDPEGEVKDPSVWRQRRTTRFGIELTLSGF